MTTTFTFDVYSTLDGYGSYAPPADWGGHVDQQTFDRDIQVLTYAPTLRVWDA